MTELIVALDFDNKKKALSMVDLLADKVQWYKVGSQLFTLYGSNIVQELVAREKKVFLDLKFFDIPNTVKNAVRSAIDIGADMVNFHASGGMEMMKSTVDYNKGYIARGKKEPCKLIAVTVLTSMDAENLGIVNIAKDLNKHSFDLAKLSYDCGVDGLVCAYDDILSFQKFGLTIVPGIRLKSDVCDDQKRVTTPKIAKENKADFIVMGRSITTNHNPKEVVLKVLKQLS